MMILLSLFLLVSSVVTTAFSSAVPNIRSHEALSPRSGTPGSSGTNGGYYYKFWTDGDGTILYTNKEAGEYNISWAGNIGNFYGGKGWNPGGERIINYSGSFNPVGTAYLSVYGWTIDPLVEYYIVESYAGSIPTQTAAKKGTVVTDGDTYDIFAIPHIPLPSIPNATVFYTYWSIRQNHRISGSVNTTAHFSAWRGLGLDLGTYDFQIVATEGYYSSGSADITVS